MINSVCRSSDNVVVLLLGLAGLSASLSIGAGMDDAEWKIAKEKYLQN